MAHLFRALSIGHRRLWRSGHHCRALYMRHQSRCGKISMLQAIRNKMHGWQSVILLGVCVLAMSLFGMESYFTSHEDSFVAKVGKHEITQQDYQDRMNQLRQQ